MAPAMVTSRRRATGFYIGGNGGYEWADYARDTRPVQHRGRVALPDVPALTENVEGPGDEQAGGNLLREAPLRRSSHRERSPQALLCPV